MHKANVYVALEEKFERALSEIDLRGMFLEAQTPETKEKAKVTFKALIGMSYYLLGDATESSLCGDQGGPRGYSERGRH